MQQFIPKHSYNTHQYNIASFLKDRYIFNQGCGAVEIIDGSGSGKAFWLRLQSRLQAKRLEGPGSGSGQKVPAPVAPAPHF